MRQSDHFAYTPGRGVVAMTGDQRIVVGNWLHLEQEGVVGTEVQKSATQTEQCLSHWMDASSAPSA